MIEPQCIPLIAYPKAWSPGLDGTLSARVVYFDAKSEADFARFKGRIKGAIVLTAPATVVSAHFEAMGHRKTDTELLELADAPEPAARGLGRRGRGQPGPNGPARAQGPAQAGNNPSAAAGQPRAGRFQMTPERLAQIELAGKKAQFLAEQGAALLIDPSPRGDGGTMFVQSASIPGASPFGGGGQRRSPRGASRSMTRTRPRSSLNSSWPRSTTIAWSG